MRDMTYAEACEKADAIKQLNAGEIYLSARNGEFPWHIADDCEPGGSHRLEISTNAWFRGTCPDTGLRFRWSFDIEPCSANGKGSYEIDSDGCREVLSKLSGKCRKKFQLYLLECAEKVKAKADEWQAITDRQMRDATILRGLAQTANA